MPKNIVPLSEVRIKSTRPGTKTKFLFDGGGLYLEILPDGAKRWAMKDLIEHQLAHAVKDPNRRAYNRTSFLAERKVMMQKWADYPDTLRLTSPPPGQTGTLFSLEADFQCSSRSRLVEQVLLPQKGKIGQMLHRQ